MKVTAEDRDGKVTVETGSGAAKATWDGQTISVGQLAKAEPERRFTLNVIYPADQADVGVAMDGHRDFASKAVVEEAAWNYMRKARAVGLCHTPEQAASIGAELAQKGAAEVVESYIYRGPDWPVADGVVIKAGDWLGGFIWTPEAWQLIREGKIGGVSVEGGARRRRPSAGALADLRN